MNVAIYNIPNICLLLELQSSISKFSQQCDQHVQYKASLEEKMEALNSQLSFLQKSNNHLTEEVCSWLHTEICIQLVIQLLVLSLNSEVMCYKVASCI